MSMKTKFKARGNWSSGVKDHFVDIRILDAFVTFLPWALAIDAIVRGWEYARIAGAGEDGILSILPTTNLNATNGESLVQYDLFGFILLATGLTLIVGLTLRRFYPIIVACLLGAASYLLIGAVFLAEGLFGTTGIGVRTGFTLLVVAALWAFKGLFAAGKKSLSEVEDEADKQTEEFLNG